MAYSPDFKRFMYQTPTWGYTNYSTPNMQNEKGIDAQVNPTNFTKDGGYFDKLKGLFGSSAGTTGNMGMGSDAASLANAESLMGSGSSSSSGLGGWGYGGIIGAAIAGQHMLSNDTDTTYEGVETDDAFGKHFGTEPWLAWAHDKTGQEPTAGEKFDAAVENDDWRNAWKRSFEMSDYWADPGSSWAESGATALGMDNNHAGWLFNPFGEITGWIGEKI